jgi:hypothetical protein
MVTVACVLLIFGAKIYQIYLHPLPHLSPPEGRQQMLKGGVTKKLTPPFFSEENKGESAKRVRGDLFTLPECMLPHPPIVMKS